MKPVLRALFTPSSSRKPAYKHLKSPAEVVVGTMRVMGGFELPRPGCGELSMQPSYMGQDLLNPPRWRAGTPGREWINSGSLMARINFVAEQVGNTQLPGVQGIVNRLQEMGVLEPEQLVDSCLDLLGPVEVGDDTQQGADRAGGASGDRSAGIRQRTEEAAAKHTGELLQLIVATREYQFA